jgi:hypothetical protein
VLKAAGAAIEKLTALLGAIFWSLAQQLGLGKRPGLEKHIREDRNGSGLADELITVEDGATSGDTIGMPDWIPLCRCSSTGRGKANAGSIR